MGKLTLSVDDAVSERAKLHAERHGTSVSAMVEEFLAAVTGNGMPLGEEARAPDVAALAAFRGKVLTAEGGPVKVSDAQRQVAAFLDNGWLVVYAGDPMNPHVVALRSQLRKLQYPVARVLLADLDAIKGLYALAANGPAVEASKAQAAFLDLIARAAHRGASDLHIVADGRGTKVRARIDGVMRPFDEFPSADVGKSLLVAAFQMADSADAAYRPYECQASSLNMKGSLPPSVRQVRMQFAPLAGEGRMGVAHIVPERPDPADAALEALGYSTGQAEALRTSLANSLGLRVVAGPTGGGRSRTLAALMGLAAEASGRHVVTVEDPVEFAIPGATQIPVVPTPAPAEAAERLRRCLAAALRMQPDTLMVGEIRDKHAASLAVDAAQSGQQVWAAIHATSALSILPRLRDLGVEDYKLADATLFPLLVSQRLVRTLCENCKQPLRRAEDPALYDWLESHDADAPRHACVANPTGCAHCLDGHSGRTLVAEVVPTSEALLRAVVVERDMERARWHLRTSKIQTMLEHALSKVRAGTVDPAQVRGAVLP